MHDELDLCRAGAARGRQRLHHEAGGDRPRADRDPAHSQGRGLPAPGSRATRRIAEQYTCAGRPSRPAPRAPCGCRESSPAGWRGSRSGMNTAVTSEAAATPKLIDICCIVLAMVLALLVSASRDVRIGQRVHAGVLQRREEAVDERPAARSAPRASCGPIVANKADQHAENRRCSTSARRDSRTAAGSPASSASGSSPRSPAASSAAPTGSACSPGPPDRAAERETACRRCRGA